MKEYKIKIDTNKEQITAPYIELVAKDYNSTALVFECDNAENYMMIFQLLRPDGTVWCKEIRDNIVVLGEENENGEIVPVITVNGEYFFDVAFYDGNSKITTTEQERLFARADIPQDDVSESPVKTVLDDLIEDVQGALVQTDNLNVSVEKIDNITTINVTHKDGSTATVQVLDGKDYILTDDDKKEIVDTTKPLVEQDIQPILENIENVANNAETIARGKASSVVKDTWVEMEAWLKDITNKGTHKIGDNLYIKAKYTDETETERQPDYWIAEVLEEPNEKGYYYEISELEADKPDLDAYAKKEQFVTLTQAEYDALEVKSANTYYFIIEEE